MSSILNELEKFSPIHDYAFGHTPLQMEYFQVSNQQGSPEFMYWQHVLQLQVLYKSIRETKIRQTELQSEIADIENTLIKFGEKWRSRKRSIPRLKFELDATESTLKQKEREAEFHYNIIRTKFSDLIEKPEKVLFESEKEYWALRLSRQLFASHMSRTLGVSEGELSAVLSLPEPMQKTIIKMLQDQKDKLLPAKDQGLLTGDKQ